MVLNPEQINQLKKRSARPPFRLLSFVGLLGSILFLVFLLVLGALYTFCPALLALYADSEQGRLAASRGLGHAIKVDGQFAPLHFKDWTIQTDSFQSTGWPGEALGGLNCQSILIVFDPSAVFRGAWRIQSVSISHAQIELLPPDDALKRPPLPKKPRPWYLFFLPDHTECGPIIAEHTDVVYTFRDQQATITDAHVEADLVGKDFKYTATSGVLNSPFLPPLKINRLEMLVTHPFIRIDLADLSGLPSGDPAHVNLSGTIGMRQNKAIDATVHIVDLPIDQLLPETLSPLVKGRATGDLVWKCNSTGKMIESEGDLTLNGLEVSHLSLFKPLRSLSGNSELDNLAFDHAKCHFHLNNGIVKLDLSAGVTNTLELDGTIGFQVESRIADLHLNVTHLILRTWMPPEMKEQTSGEAQAALDWHGRMDSVKDSSGSLSINMDGTQIETPPILRIVLRKKEIKAPGAITMKTGRFQFVYSNEAFELNQCDLDLPGILALKMVGEVSADKTLTARLTWTGLRAEDWLPGTLADELTAEIQGEANIQVHDWHLGEGSYSGHLNLLGAKLRYTSIQSALGRFLDDKSLLVLPLNRAELDWSYHERAVQVSNINFQGGDRLAIKGDVDVAGNKRLSGRLWIGIKPQYLASFYGLGDRIFFRKEDGLRWSLVHVSGDTEHPTEDFSKQLKQEMLKHPFSALQFGGKMVSWLVGGWLGNDKSWKRPEESGHTE